jgi:hypothetical protein
MFRYMCTILQGKQKASFKNLLPLKCFIYAVLRSVAASLLTTINGTTVHIFSPCSNTVVY